MVHNLNEVREVLQDIGLQESDTKAVLNKLAAFSHNPFEGLMTEYKQVQGEGQLLGESLEDRKVAP